MAVALQRRTKVAALKTKDLILIKNIWQKCQPLNKSNKSFYKVLHLILK
jgi:hypothetical protein